MTTETITNLIPDTPFGNLSEGNIPHAVSLVLQYTMGNWYWFLLAIITLFAVYIRTQSMAYTAALGVIMALLMLEMPFYARGIIYIVVVLGVAMALFKVFGRRDR